MSGLRIIFLDFDGVLNSTRWFVSLGLGADNPRCNIDRGAVAVLREIVSKTSAKVVVSSTWRKSHKLDELVAFLRECGFDGDVIGVTPDYFALRHQRDGKPYVRGDEIQAWLTQNADPVEAFAILDDDEDMGHLHDRLIRTDGNDGLLWGHIDAVVAQLLRAVD